MDRRATLMLALTGVAGIASPPIQAGADFLGAKGERAISTAASNKGGLPIDPKRKSAPPFQNLKMAGLERQVVSIHFHQDRYSVTTADGRSTDFWETNLRFKIDSSDTGPLGGKPVILPAGITGDRASVFFSSPTEISALIKRRTDS